MSNLEQSTTDMNERKASSNELDSIMLEAELDLQTPEALQKGLYSAQKSCCMTTYQKQRRKSLRH